MILIKTNPANYFPIECFNCGKNYGSNLGFVESKEKGELIILCGKDSKIKCFKKVHYLIEYDEDTFQELLIDNQINLNLYSK